MTDRVINDDRECVLSGQIQERRITQQATRALLEVAKAVEVIIRMDLYTRDSITWRKLGEDIVTAIATCEKGARDRED